MGKTLYEKIWESHLIEDNENGSLIYIDKHLVHEVTSPQAFEGLRINKRKIKRPETILAVADHNVPTENRISGIKDETSKLQVDTLEKNCAEFGLEYYSLNDKRQGIVHVIGPEQGFTLPGTTLVCGDSHTSTHGAFGALAFGIGTSEVEHVLATQTLRQKKSKNLKVEITGAKASYLTAKDIILSIIKKLGTAGGTGYVIEFCGEAIMSLSQEERMTICNMSIEAGARAGLIAPDETTFAYLKGRNLAPKGEAFTKAVQYWQNLKSDADAKFDKIVTLDAAELTPQVTWGTSPEDVVEITGYVPYPDQVETSAERIKTKERALQYMGLKAGTKITDIKIDKVFIGSCTNSRIEDLRAVAKLVAGRKVAPNVYAMIVPGSGLVRLQAEEEGLDKIFVAAGFDWREPGCSMCLAMNADRLEPGERCASTSNRNFEGRQGRGGRTHLMSPEMAAAAALSGHLVDVREFI